MPGENKEDALEEMFRFSLPSGDAGVVSSRKDVQFHPRGTSTFAPEETMEFELDPGRQAIDPQHCWITARLALTDSAGAALTAPDATALGHLPYAYLPAGTSGLISRLQIMTKNGDVLEDIEDYNRLSYVLDMFTLSDEWMANEGQDECFPFPESMEPTDYVREEKVDASLTFTMDQQGLASDNLAYRLPGSATRRKALPFLYKATNSTAQHVKIRLRLSAIFGDKTIIPPALGPIIVKITLAKADVAFTTVGFSAATALTAPVAATIATKKGTDGLRYLTNSYHSAAQYRLWQPKFNVRTLELSSTFRDAMNKAVNGSGLPRVISTWFTTQSPISANNASAPLSITANKVTANARAALAQINITTQSSNGKEWERNSFDCVSHGLSSWRFRLGVEHFPDRYVDNAMDSLARTRFAIPDVGDRPAGVPAIRYDPDLNYFGGSGSVSHVGGDATVGDVTDAKHAPLLYHERQPNLVVRGVSFQNVKDMALSGLSTNTGTQVELQCTWDSTAGSTATTVQNYSIHGAILRMHLYYTRLIVIGANGISIRE